MNVEDASENVPAEDKGKVETEINCLSDYKIGQYLDVTLLKKIGGEQEQKITETNVPLKITFEIPEGLRGKAEYSVIRVHNGTAAFLRDLDGVSNTVTIKTDKFSTYALVYREKSSGTRPAAPGGGTAGDDNTDTGDSKLENGNNTSTGDINPTDGDSAGTSDINLTDGGSIGISDNRPNGADSFDTAPSGDGNLASDTAPQADGYSSVKDNTEQDGNPSTGIAVSLIPLTAAAALTAAFAKRKKK